MTKYPELRDETMPIMRCFTQELYDTPQVQDLVDKIPALAIMFKDRLIVSSHCLSLVTLF